MDDNLKLLTEIGVTLSTLAVKGTVSSITAKMKMIKTEKDLDSVRNQYDEIINELLSEREEAIRIAQIYKSEVERLVISDDDIEHLQNTTRRIITILEDMTPETNLNSFSQFQELVNADTLKAMQLLGFNFKAAIGEPLTELCANAILSKTNAKKQSNYQPNKKK